MIEVIGAFMFHGNRYTVYYCPEGIRGTDCKYGYLFNWPGAFNTNPISNSDVFRTLDLVNEQSRIAASPTDCWDQLYQIVHNHMGDGIKVRNPIDEEDYVLKKALDK